MLRLARETALTWRAVVALHAHATLPRREEARLTELLALVTRRRCAGVLAGAACEQRRREQHEKNGPGKHHREAGEERTKASRRQPQSNAVHGTFVAAHTSITAPHTGSGALHEARPPLPEAPVGLKEAPLPSRKLAIAPDMPETGRRRISRNSPLGRPNTLRTDAFCKCLHRETASSRQPSDASGTQATCTRHDSTSVAAHGSVTASHGANATRVSIS